MKSGSLGSLSSFTKEGLQWTPLGFMVKKGLDLRVT